VGTPSYARLVSGRAHPTEKLWMGAIRRLSACPSLSTTLYFWSKEDAVSFAENAPPIADLLLTMTINGNAKWECVPQCGGCCVTHVTSSSVTLEMNPRLGND